MWTLTYVLSSASYLCQRGETADHTIFFGFALMTDDSISLTRGKKSSKVGKGLKPAPHVLHGVAFTDVYILCGNVKTRSWLGFGLLPQMLPLNPHESSGFSPHKIPKKKKRRVLAVVIASRTHSPSESIHLRGWGFPIDLYCTVGHPPSIGNPYDGYINPYYWVDDHPLFPYYIYICKEWESRP